MTNLSQNVTPRDACDRTTDIVIVGGGFAGTLAALTLARRGLTVTIVDPYDPFPPLFRADKLDNSQMSLLEQLGLREAFAAVATPVTQVINIRGASILDRRRVEDYGISYQTMVALLRGMTGAGVRRIVGRAVDIRASDDIQRVELADGETISGRLAIIATGAANVLRTQLGIERRVIRKAHSVSVGFSLAPPAEGFSFPSLSACGERVGDKIDYINFLPIGDLMRANLFLYADAGDPRLAALRSRPLPTLFEMLPGLKRWFGDSEILGKVEIGVVDLAICYNVVQDGVVLIGDAFRTSCPAVGTGLSCILVDVIRLNAYIDQWMASPGMAADKIAAFYEDPIKVARDARAHDDAIERRRMTLDATVARRVRRSARFAARIWRDRLLGLVGKEPAPLRKTV